MPFVFARTAALVKALAACIVLAGCSATTPVSSNTSGEQSAIAKQILSHQQYPPPVFTAESLLPDDYVAFSARPDPWEGMNRRIYNFNYHFDQWIFLPVVRSYNTYVPSIARTGVSNFFDNFRDARTMVNSLLQLSPSKFFDSTGRVLINSTVGIFGLVDVATMMKIPQPQEDFGQTLGRWGVPQGPYLVLPVLGPSNLRDGFGLLPDNLMLNTLRNETLSDPVLNTSTLLDPIDTRDATSFRYYETGMTFEYQMMRWLYSTKRELDVLK